jgi:hypothetical protein
MHASLTAKPAAQVFSAIQALDLESVKSRVMDAELGEGWTQEYADSVEAAYKTYLTMLVKYPDDSEAIMLSTDVDEFWHTHILQTAKYMQDCEQVFGFYLHHNPHVGERTAADLEQREAFAARTQELYLREFGSAQRADAAWAGKVAKFAMSAGNAAYSAAPVISDIRAEKAAYSAAPVISDIRAENSAYSAAPVISGTLAERAAYSAAPVISGIRAENAAYSAAPVISGIRAENAAYSAAPVISSIRAENAAYSAAPIISGIHAANAAYSAAPLIKTAMQAVAA